MNSVSLKMREITLSKQKELKSSKKIAILRFILILIVSTTNRATFPNQPKAIDRFDLSYVMSYFGTIGSK